MRFRKTPSKIKTPKRTRCILVLWGEYFDETAATIFTVTLRQAGLCVRMVGVNGLAAAGRNGLVLHSDMGLSAVKPLMDGIFCLILPCDAASLKRLENDPRIHELFAGAAHNGAQFVVQDEGLIEHSLLHSLTIPSHKITLYNDYDDLIALGQRLVIALLPAAAGAPKHASSRTVQEDIPYQP